MPAYSKTYLFTVLLIHAYPFENTNFTFWGWRVLGSPSLPTQYIYRVLDTRSHPADDKNLSVGSIVPWGVWFSQKNERSPFCRVHSRPTV